MPFKGSFKENPRASEGAGCMKTMREQASSIHGWSEGISASTGRFKEIAETSN